MTRRQLTEGQSVAAVLAADCSRLSGRCLRVWRTREGVEITSGAGTHPQTVLRAPRETDACHYLAGFREAMEGAHLFESIAVQQSLALPMPPPDLALFPAD